MSWQATAWVWTIPNLSANERLIGLALANYAGQDGTRIFPGVTRISHETSLSEASVKRAIKALKDCGALIQITQGDGRGHASEFRMPVDMQDVADHEKAKKGFKSAYEKEERGSESNGKGFTQSHKGVHSELPILQLTYQEEPKDSLPTKTKGSRLAADWKPTEADMRFGYDLGLDIKTVAAKFKDYWIAKPGAAGIKLDWSATWRNWCRSALERGQDLRRDGGQSGRVGTYI